jgi:hypothetical protein
VQGEGLRLHERPQLAGAAGAAFEEMGDDGAVLLPHGRRGGESLQGVFRGMIHWMSFPVAR